MLYQGNNFRIQFPDGTPEPEMNNAIQAAQQQQNQYATLGQIGQIVQDVFRPQTTISPRVDRLAAAAMTPDALQNTMQLQQQGQIAEQNAGLAREEMQQRSQIDQGRQRMQMQQLLQQEKDRAQQFKYQKMVMDNQEADRALKERLATQDEERRKEEETRRASEPRIMSNGQAVYRNPDGTLTASDIEGYRSPVSGGGSGGGGGDNTGGPRRGQWMRDPNTGQTYYKEWNPDTGRWEVPVDDSGAAGVSPEVQQQKELFRLERELIEKDPDMLVEEKMSLIQDSYRRENEFMAKSNQTATGGGGTSEQTPNAQPRVPHTWVPVFEEKTGISGKPWQGGIVIKQGNQDVWFSLDEYEALLMEQMRLLYPPGEEIMSVDGGGRLIMDKNGVTYFKE